MKLKSGSYIKLLLSGLLGVAICLQVLAGTSIKYLKDGEYCTISEDTKVNMTGKLVGTDIPLLQQMDTGKYRKINCGPTCVAMVGSVFGKDIKVEDLNNFIKPAKNGYNFEQIEKMLRKYEIKFEDKKFYEGKTRKVEESCFVDLLDNEHLILTIINTKNIRTLDELKANNIPNLSNKMGRTYKGDFNHYVICAGYIKVENELYYQILDPLETIYRYIPAKDYISSCIAVWDSYLLFNIQSCRKEKMA